MFTKYKRILLKLSGEIFAGERDSGIDPKKTENLAREIKEVVDLGVEVAIVLGGGNLFRGAKASENGMDRVTGDYIGMIATIMNAIAFHSALEAIGCSARIQTAIPMQNLAEPYIRAKALHHLEKGRAVIFAGGTGNPFFTTDTTAALRAAEIGAEIILKATTKTADAAMVDKTAMTLCEENEIPVLVFNVSKPGSILKVVRGEK